MTYAIGLDIGGTKIAAALVDEEGTLFQRTEVSSDVTDKETMFKKVIHCIEQTLAASTVSMREIAGIGVGVPGKVDRNKGIAVYQNNLPWRDFPLVQRLQDYFNIDRIIIDNDVYMATFSEWKQHGANIDETFVYLTVSTGISCAIIQEGRFIRGSGFAGEVGLFPLFQKKDSFERLEHLASGKSISVKYRNDSITTKDIFARYHAGDSAFQEPIDKMIHSLAYSTYMIQCMLDPNTLIFGGGVMNHQPFLLEEIKQEMKKYLIDEQKHVIDQMFVSKSKGDTGIIGAGLAVFHQPGD